MSQVYDRIVVASYVDTVGEEYAHDIPLDTDTSSLDQSALELFMRKRIHELELESDQRLSSFAAEGKETSFCLSQQADFDTDRQQYAAQEAAAILTLLRPNPADAAVTLTKQRFVDRLTELASAVDRKRSAPVFLSMLLVGASVGVVTPAMPFIVQALELNASQYGAAVSAFALAKMLGNVPAAIAVERHGRKPYMTYSLAVIALGVGGIGWAGSFEELYACRLLTGLGVAALSTAGTLMVTDLSTPLNRASTYAPIMSAFAAGTALGPALGGMLVDQLGLHATFYAVGVSYLGVALLNRSILSETKSQPIQFPWQKQLRQKEQTLSRDSDKSQNESLGSALNGAVGQWVPLLKDPAVRSVMIMNGIYWIALAGSQMTLLPLMLTDVNGLAFTATQVGQVYMGMSLVQIVGNPVFARISDTVGKVPVIVGATTLISAAMLALPYFCGSGMGGQEISMVSLAGTLGVWSMGSSMLSTAPLAYVSDRVDEAKRAQAIALLRTCGDVGFLLGATGSGALADWAGNLDVAMQSSAGLLLTATAWFTARQILTRRLEAAAGAAAATMERRDR